MRLVAPFVLSLIGLVLAFLSFLSTVFTFILVLFFDIVSGGDLMGSDLVYFLAFSSFMSLMGLSFLGVLLYLVIKLGGNPSKNICIATIVVGGLGILLGFLLGIGMFIGSVLVLIGGIIATVKSGV